MVAPNFSGTYSKRGGVRKFRPDKKTKARIAKSKARAKREKAVPVKRDK